MDCKTLGAGSGKDQGQRKTENNLIRFVTYSEMHGLIIRKTFSCAERTQDFIYCEVFKCQPKCFIDAQKKEAMLSSEKKSMTLETYKSDALCLFFIPSLLNTFGT